jgi:predicted permease
MNALFRKLGWLASRRRKEAELEEELRFHLEEEAESAEASGLTSVEARQAARRELGNLALVQENTRASWSWALFDQLAQDTRHAFRAMSANKAFTALAALSLALGIGANTAMYSFMDAILLRSLPVRDPALLVLPTWRVHQRESGGDSVVQAFSGSWGDEPNSGFVTGNIFPYPAFEAMQKKGEVFSSLFGYYGAAGTNVNIHGQSETENGLYVTGGYFSGLGVPPAAGRLIEPDDDRFDAPPVVVLSAALAKSRFGGAVEALGQSILVNNVPVPVVGVASPEFFGVDPGSAPQFYVPLHSAPALEGSNPFGLKAKSFLEEHFYWLRVTARLRPGVTMAQAEAAMAPPFHQWAESTAENDRQRADLPVLVMRAGGSGLTGLRRQYSQPLFVLMVLVGLILAIACANIANLLLSRAAARKREIALRLSVGAGRLRLIRQLLTESVLLSAVGGTLGILFAIWGMHALTLLLANGQKDFTLHAELNWHVMGVAAALSLLTGILFGLAPALQATRVDILPSLKALRTGERRSRFRVSLSHVLIVSQIALSLLMLVGAGLFTRTMFNLQHIAVGFNRENLLLFQLNALQSGHSEPEIVSFYSDLQRRFAAIPGVRDASLAITTLVGNGHWGVTVTVNGQEAKGTMFITVGPRYFATMQIPMLAGREIDDRDRPGMQPVAVVNEQFARENFPGRSPLGQYFHFGDTPEKPMVIQIVGVSSNPLYGDLREKTPPTVFIAYNQGAWPVREMIFSLRTAGNPMQYAGAVRQIVHRADLRLPVADVRTQAAAIDQTINQEIIFARLCTLFALLALAIACVGLYGTVSYHVARRTGEIGVRMALGAQRSSVVWMILRSVFVLAAAGIAIGVKAALAASTLVESFLFGLKPTDTWSLVVAGLTLLAAALLAGYAPAWRASRIDPMSALRNE